MFSSDAVAFSLYAQFNKMLIMFVVSFPHHSQGKVEYTYVYVNIYIICIYYIYGAVKLL